MDSTTVREDSSQDMPAPGEDQLAPILLDMDTGADDALAIGLLMAYAPERLVAVIATYGNVTQSVAQRNTRDVLDLLGAGPIPVFDGCRCPSWADGFVADRACAHFHGDNGLADLHVSDYMPAPARQTNVPGVHSGGAVYDFSANDIDFTVAGTVSAGALGADTQHNTAKPHAAAWTDEPAATQSAEPELLKTMTPPIISVGGYLPKLPNLSSAPLRGRNLLATLTDEYGPVEMAVRPADTSGVKAIIEAARRWGKNLTVVCTGPLTDVAAAMIEAPDIIPHLRLIIMGGALTQQGNCFDMVSETNILQDPEAADLVFRSLADITMVGLDVTHRCLLDRQTAEGWANSGKVGRFFADLASFMITANADADPMFAAGAPMHDPLAVAAAIDPSLIRVFDIAMCVDTATGNREGVRGRTIGDGSRLNDPSAPCCHVALDVDAPRFLDMLDRGIPALSQRLA